MEKGFSFRGLEIHTRRLYNMGEIERSIEFCKEFGLNSLILHQNDIVDRLVLPSKYISQECCETDIIIRFSLMRDTRAYLKNVCRKCHQAGIKLYFETKEFYFGDGLFQCHPEGFNPDGTMCATHPFWFEFLEEKYRELVEDIFPEIDGVICSPGTRESRVSLAKNKCTCPRCKAADPVEWYRDIVEAMYRPLKKNGKMLAIRDFSFNRENTEVLMQGVEATHHKDIVMALKSAPQDYYPTFPNNPKIGEKNGHPQFVEYDVNGQFFGLGFFATSQVEDLKHRMNYAYEHQVDGIWLRSDWDNGNETGCFNSLTMVNLIGGAMLANNIETNVDTIYQTWCKYGLYNTCITGSAHQTRCVPQNPDAWKYLKDYLTAAAEVINKAAYCRKNIFMYSSQYQDCITRLERFLLRSVLNSYDPEALARIEPTDENIAKILEEKNDAIELAKTLKDRLHVEELGLDPAFKADMKLISELWVPYVIGFKKQAEGYFYYRKAKVTNDEADKVMAEKAIDGMLVYADELQALVDPERVRMPHYFMRVLCYESLRSLANEMRQQLAS